MLVDFEGADACLVVPGEALASQLPRRTHAVREPSRGADVLLLTLTLPKLGRKRSQHLKGGGVLNGIKQVFCSRSKGQCRPKLA